MWPSLPRDRMTVVVAKEQSQGRGRFKDRLWISPRGNLYLTYALFLDRKRKDVAHLGQIAALGVSLAASMYDVSGGKLCLKWPNDIMVHTSSGLKKVGGVLVEVLDDSTHHVCLIGVGLNIETVPVLQERSQPVTALLEKIKMEADLKEITETVIDQLVMSFNLFIGKGFVPFLEAYAGMLVHQPGDLLVSTQGGKKIEGHFLGIDPSGALILNVDGDRRLFVAGEWN